MSYLALERRGKAERDKLWITKLITSLCPKSISSIELSHSHRRFSAVIELRLLLETV
jgi:hypothetical protein